MNIFSRSGDIRDQSLKWFKIDRNFACFWPPNFLRERPRIFGEGYKIRPDSDHVVKFQGDRSRELGETVANKKRYITGKTETLPSGGLTGILLPCDALRCTVFVIVILSVRLSVCLSVRLSVCHTRGLCPHGSTYDHDFFTIW